MKATDSMIPDWLIQLTWFAAGVCATGAFWYFLSKQNYLPALWSGFGALVLALTAVTFHLHNDLKHKAVRSENTLTAMMVIPSVGISSVANPSEKDSAQTVSSTQTVSSKSVFPDRQDAEIASADKTYSPMTMEEYFDRWFYKASTNLQRDELEALMLNRRIIWNGTIKSIENGSNDIIRVIVETIDKSGGTALLDFDKQQKQQLVELHKGQQIRFTGRIRSFVASPFLSECKILKILN